MRCLSTCCCCFTTSQGAIIIGIITMLPHIAGVGLLSHLLNTWSSVQMDVESWAQNVSDTLASSGSQIPAVTDTVGNAAADMKTVIIALLIYCVALVVASGMLISGTCQGSRCMMLPWMTIVVLSILTEVVGLFLFFYIVNKIKDCDVKNRFVYGGVAVVPEVVVMTYFWVCVFSHYYRQQQLEEQVYPAGEEEPVQMLPPVDGHHKY